MPRPILPGFAWNRGAARYYDTSRGQFVSRNRILNLLEQNVNGAEDRLGNIIQAVFNKEIAPGFGQTLMRDELRRLSLQNSALGKGGIDKLSFADYGRVGRQLRDTYQRVSNLMRDIEVGRATLPQAMNRIQGYVLDARRQFFAAEREALRQADTQFEERRILHARESCSDCINYARMGWQKTGILPLPGEGGTKCGSHCRCTIERRELTPQMMQDRMRTQLERMMA